jgi:hemerythrin superfamily protein
MNALKLLEEQHDEVDTLIEEIEKGRSMDLKTKRFAELADKLAAHAAIEEKIFYPAVMAKQTEDILLESVEEHLSVKRLLADMMKLDVTDDAFDAKLSVIKEQLQHHAHEEEEKELFPKVKKLLAKDELEALGDQMQAKFEELLQRSPRRQVPNETAEAAHLPHPA